MSAFAEFAGAYVIGGLASFYVAFRIAIARWRSGYETVYWPADLSLLGFLGMMLAFLALWPVIDCVWALDKALVGLNRVEVLPLVEGRPQRQRPPEPGEVAPEDEG